MNRRILINILLFMLFFNFAFSSLESIFHSANIEIKEVNYIDGKLKINFIIHNLESFPLINQKIVIDLVRGCENPIYPSQLSNCDNIIKEWVIDDIFIQPFSKLEYKFEKEVELAKGKYRLDLYASDIISPSVGIHYIFSPGVWINFDVEDGKKVSEEIKILRKETNFNGYTGPIGFPADPNENIKGEIFIESSRDFDGILEISVCSWDDINCLLGKYNFTFKKEQKINLKKGLNKINVEFTAPSKPDAYSILLVIKDLNGEMHSLYRSRVVVKGETAKIRKLVIDKVPVIKDEQFKIFVKVGTSPDHYTKPTIKNVKVKTYLLDENNIIIKQWENLIDKLSSSENILYKIIEIDDKIDKDLKKFKLCSENVYEKVCFEIDELKLLKIPYEIFARPIYWNETYVKVLVEKNDDKYKGILTNVFSSEKQLILSKEIYFSKEAFLEIKLEEPLNKLILIFNDNENGLTKRIEIQKPKTFSENKNKTIYITLTALFFAVLVIIIMIKRKRLSHQQAPLVLVITLLFLTVSFSYPYWSNPEVKELYFPKRYNFSISWNDSIYGYGGIKNVTLETNVSGILSNYTNINNDTLGNYWIVIQSNKRYFTYRWYASNLDGEWNSTSLFTYSTFDSDGDGVPNNIDKCYTPNTDYCNVANGIINPDTGCPYKPVKEFRIYGDFSSSCPYSSIPIYANFSECLSYEDAKLINGTFYLSNSQNYILNENCNLYDGTEGWLCYDRHCCEAYVGGNVQSGNYNLKVNYSLHGINYSETIKQFTINNVCDTSQTCGHGGHVRDTPTINFNNNCILENGVYYCGKNSIINVTLTSTVVEECNNGVTASIYPGILAWIYKGRTPVDLLHNYYAGCAPPDYIRSRDRNYLLDTSRTSGFLWACDISWQSGGQQTTTSYKFTEDNTYATYYLYVDYINAVCDSPDYICPNSIDGNPCRIGYIGSDSKGFEYLATYTIVYDSKPPLITLEISPLDQQSTTAGSNEVNYRVITYDELGIKKIEVYLDGEIINSCNNIDICEGDIVFSKSGQYSIEAKVWDKMNNYNSTSKTFFASFANLEIISTSLDYYKIENNFYFWVINSSYKIYVNVNNSGNLEATDINFNFNFPNNWDVKEISFKNSLNANENFTYIFEIVPKSIVDIYNSKLFTIFYKSNLYQKNVSSKEFNLTILDKPIIRDIELFGDFNELNIKVNYSYYGNINRQAYYSCSLNNNQNCTAIGEEICKVKNPNYNLTLDCNQDGCDLGLNKVICEIYDPSLPQEKNTYSKNFRALSLSSIISQIKYISLGENTLWLTIKNEGIIEDNYKITFNYSQNILPKVDKYFTDKIKFNQVKGFEIRFINTISGAGYLKINITSSTNENVYKAFLLELQSKEISLADLDNFSLIQILLFASIIFLILNRNKK